MEHPRVAAADPEYEAQSSQDYSDSPWHTSRESFRGFDSPLNLDLPASSDWDVVSRSEPRRSLTRSPSRHSVSVALTHPKPDPKLEQGGFVGNVERLEESAERISLYSDIGEEIRKLNSHSKRSESQQSSLNIKIGSRKFSGSSHIGSHSELNSLSHSGGFSPTAHVYSFAGSGMSHPLSERNVEGSANYISRMPTHESIMEEPQQDEPLAVAVAPASALRVINDGQTSLDADQHESEDEEEHHSIISAPRSVASNENSEHDEVDHFAEFDGVHAGSDASELDLDIRRASLADTLQFPVSEPEVEEPYIPYPVKDNMVYYPAPVPRLLNLPPKLSQASPPILRAKRRSELFGASAGARGSAGRLSQMFGNGEAANDIPSDEHRASRLPPQLRASVFFDQEPVQQKIELVGGSAVDTLDSILEASKNAPVSAFTDHPLVGAMGAEGVYGSARYDANLASVLLESGYNEEGLERDETLGTPPPQEAFLGKPATLVAELQLRKAYQKQRSRTAATAFPHGIHSTLLELDAVAQIQKNARKYKPVALAWEDASAAHEDDPEDDVPLAVLFPGNTQAKPTNSRSPLHPSQTPSGPDSARRRGLLEQHALEEGETLAQRRARLRGEPPPAPALSNDYNLEVRGVTAPDTTQSPPTDDQEGETLAQRAQRLKIRATKRVSSAPHQSRISTDFASELMSQFGGLAPQRPESSSKKDKAAQESRGGDDADHVEESLGQRRKRLQAERQQQQTQPALQPRHSMAGLLSMQAAPGLAQRPGLPRASTMAYSSPGSGPGQAPFAHMQSRPSTGAWSRDGLGGYRMGAIPLAPGAGYLPSAPTRGVVPGYGQPVGYLNQHMMGQQPLTGFGYPSGYGQGYPSVFPTGYPPAGYHAAMAAMDTASLTPKQRATIDRWRQGIS